MLRDMEKIEITESIDIPAWARELGCLHINDWKACEEAMREGSLDWSLEYLQGKKAEIVALLNAGPEVAGFVPKQFNVQIAERVVRKWYEFQSEPESEDFDFPLTNR